MSAIDCVNCVLKTLDSVPSVCVTIPFLCERGSVMVKCYGCAMLTLILPLCYYILIKEGRVALKLCSKNLTR